MSEMRKPPILRHRKNHIPHDIVLNILTGLPVKSLMRFRCVSKSLDSSITSSDFIYTHLNNFNNNNNINHHDNDNSYVIHIGSDDTHRVCTVALDRTFDRISEIPIPFDFPYPRVEIVGSCNGLLCLADFDDGNVIYLWNPSIRKFKKLPHTCLEKLNYINLGFAYHSQNNDYKVVRFSSLSMVIEEIEVYTLSSDSWRTVEISLGTIVIYYLRNFHWPIPLVSGALHWMAIVIDGGENPLDNMIIMAFDVNSEKFRKLALPHGSTSTNGNGFPKYLSSFKGKLALITSEYNEQAGFRLTIWVMRKYGVVESWTKLFVVPYERVAHCAAFTECASILMFPYTRRPVEENKYKFVLIDAETLKEKKDLDIQNPPSVTTFLESLVSLDGANVVSY